MNLDFNKLTIQSDGFAGRDSFDLEFCQVAMLSEPLDWTSEWVQPEWRYGT